MKVRLFAALREIAGASSLDVDANDVGALVEDLSARFGPEFARIARAGAVVVDGEKVDRDHVLKPNQEVALLPPASGGDGEWPAGGT